MVLPDLETRGLYLNLLLGNFRNAREIMEEALHPASVLEYLRALIKEYAARQKFDPSNLSAMPGFNSVFDMYELNFFKYQELKERIRNIHGVA